jgi:hypothetical protein
MTFCHSEHWSVNRLARESTIWLLPTNRRQDYVELPDALRRWHAGSANGACWLHGDSTQVYDGRSNRYFFNNADVLMLCAGGEFNEVTFLHDVVGYGTKDTLEVGTYHAYTRSLRIVAGTVN